jgi:ABC-2 type transport system ATP-binding protein
VIQVEKLTKRYGDTLAIDSLDFEVRRGEVVGFLGPNGAGKSTTMRILTGALGATSGRALVGGIDVYEKPRAVKQLVGYLPEAPPLYVDMTVRGYLRFCARLKGASNPKQAVETVIRRVGLESVAHRLIDHLSKGYRQRVGIAQALVHEPKVLILDEPASGLDPAQRKEIRDLVRELADGDTTVILSTHVLPEVEAICDRVIIIRNGRIVASDQLASLGGGASTIRLTVARPDDALIPALLAVPEVGEVTRQAEGRYHIAASADVREQVAQVAVGYGLLELTGHQGLEEVYLQLTGGEE